MLCLTRKKNEVIHIGTDIVIRINRINGDKVSVGIDAPREVAILRPESFGVESDKQLKFDANGKVIIESQKQT